MTARPQVFSVVSSERVFDGAVTSVRVDDVVMPGGGTAKREVVEHDGAVAIVALDAAGRSTGGDRHRRLRGRQVILIEQYRHPLGRRLWELPAGLMDVDGEGGAADRGPRAGRGDRLRRGDTGRCCVDVATSPGFTEEIVRIFLATELTAGRPPGSGEHEEADLRVVRVPLSVAVQAVLAGRIVNVMAVSGILAAERTVLRGTGAAHADPVGDLPWTSLRRHRHPGSAATGGIRGSVTAPSVTGSAAPVAASDGQ